MSESCYFYTKLLVFAKCSCELLFPLNHHEPSMHICLLNTKQDDDVSYFQIHMSLLSFSSFVVVEKFSIVVQKGTVMESICFIFELYQNFHQSTELYYCRQ